MTFKIVLLSLSIVAASTPAFSQSANPTLYAFHTGRLGDCPGLDWHVAVEPDSRLNGFVAWDGGKHMARLDGNINKDRAFQIRAEEVGGQGRTAMVKGTATGDYINASITGSGTSCDNKPLTIPRVVGGTDGGAG